MISVDWAKIKTFVDTRKVALQWLDMGNFYWLVSFDGPFALECHLEKGTSDATDFETNYQSSTTANRSPIGKVAQTLGEDDFTLKAQGFRFQPSAGSVSDHDYLLDKAYAINGGTMFAQGAILGDKLTFSVVDKDNVLGNGAGFVLPNSDFLSGWCVVPNQLVEIVDLSVSKLPVPGLYIRMTYDARQTSAADIIVNFRLYEVT